jgi:hypothetical protein
VIHAIVRLGDDVQRERFGDVGLDHGEGRVALVVGQVPAAAGQKVVDDGDVVPGSKEHVDDVAADEPTTTSHQGAQGQPPSLPCDLV